VTCARLATYSSQLGLKHRERVGGGADLHGQVWAEGKEPLAFLRGEDLKSFLAHPGCVWDPDGAVGEPEAGGGAEDRTRSGALVPQP
jgi:hypothetical protein